MDGVGSIGRRQHDDGRVRVVSFEFVEQVAQAPDDALFLRAAAALLPVAARGHGVHLVEEDERGRVRSRGVKRFPQIRLGLARLFGQNLRAVDEEEVGARFSRDGPSEARLAAAGRAVEQNAARRRDAHGLEELRPLERRLDELAHRRDGFVDAAEVVVAHVVLLLGSEPPLVVDEHLAAPLGHDAAVRVRRRRRRVDVDDAELDDLAVAVERAVQPVARDERHVASVQTRREAAFEELVRRRVSF
mmetsp:Transcript_18718/g.55488  ORF Transcript_18718/g.55488 Transcript_18718/m.55488 type:complete len:246 (+) Transcript_18718:1308-2045(+)